MSRDEVHGRGLPPVYGTVVDDNVIVLKVNNGTVRMAIFSFRLDSFKPHLTDQ